MVTLTFTNFQTGIKINYFEIGLLIVFILSSFSLIVFGYRFYLFWMRFDKYDFVDNIQKPEQFKEYQPMVYKKKSKDPTWSKK